MYKSNGFSLIELLVTVAIIGILAAVGVTAYSGYIGIAKEKAATTGLSSIYLAQTEYRSMNGIYYNSRTTSCTSSTNDTDLINGDSASLGLFNGDKILDGQNFRWCINGNGTTFQAHAWSIENDQNYFIIDNQNIKTKVVTGTSSTW